MDNLWVGAYEGKTFENHITTASNSSGKRFALKMVTTVATADVKYKIVATQEPGTILHESNTLGEALRHLKHRRDGLYEPVTYL